MKILLKESKVKRLKKILETNSFFIVCNNSSLTFEKFLRLNQKLLNSNLCCLKVNTKLLKYVYNRSIFKNYINSLSGSIMLILIKKPGCLNFNFRNVVCELKEYKVDILGVCYNYTMYSGPQLNKLTYLSYDKNVELLYRTFRHVLKKPCSKFIK
jgi:hypothetical protein